jgi:hypothetical protein
VVADSAFSFNRVTTVDDKQAEKEKHPIILKNSLSLTEMERTDSTQWQQVTEVGDFSIACALWR